MLHIYEREIKNAVGSNIRRYMISIRLIKSEIN